MNQILERISNVWLNNATDIVIRATLLAVLIGLGAVFLRKSSAAARHLILLLAMSSLLALPALSVFLPRWEVPWLHDKPAAKVVLASSPYVESVNTSAAPSVISSTSMLFIVWVSVMGLMVARIGLGLLRVRGLRLRSIPLETGELFELTKPLVDACGFNVQIRVGVHQEPPMTWGFRKPVLLLPEQATEWPESRTRAVILHELAHIKRYDWLSQLFAETLRAVYWFHPAAWVLARQLQIESERACDDQVLEAGYSPIDYASVLLDVVRSLQAPYRDCGLALSMAKSSQIQVRVKSILERGAKRRPVSGILAWSFVACVAAAAATVAAAVPTHVQNKKSLSPEIAVVAHPLPTEPVDNSDLMERRVEAREEIQERHQEVREDVSEAVADLKEAAFSDMEPAKQKDIEKKLQPIDHAQRDFDRKMSKLQIDLNKVEGLSEVERKQIKSELDHAKKEFESSMAIAAESLAQANCQTGGIANQAVHKATAMVGEQMKQVGAITKSIVQTSVRASLEAGSGVRVSVDSPPEPPAKSTPTHKP